MGTEGTTVAREVRVIDLSDFEARRAEITEQLWSAAVEIGFFQVSHHGIAQADIDAAFARSAAFFAQAETTKAQWPLARNAGWESRAQIRPPPARPT
jgi:isopenicillin N synthase-like dioxygenase